MLPDNCRIITRYTHRNYSKWECRSPDSRIGFGGSGRGCVSSDQPENLIQTNSCGNVAHCKDGDKGDTNDPVMGYIMAR